MSKSMSFFSWKRFLGIFYKEFIQIRRDRITLAMMIGLPLMQLILFGYAINTNPRHLPTAVVTGDHSAFTRQYINGLVNTKYFEITHYPETIEEAEDLMAQGKILFIIKIPPDFTRRLIRNLRPQLLLEADATDSVAIANAMAAVPVMTQAIFDPIIKGNLQYLKFPETPIDLVVHQRYNPEQITAYNIVPGLLGVVLTLTMVIITSMAMTRERERGTMENLLATPVKPLEVMIGKLIPYVLVGYVQVTLILLAARFLFHVPFEGSVILLVLCLLPFIAANLSVGLMFSSVADNQLQASQYAIFFFLPSILLSGFMFPFYGMPLWAEYVGSLLPLTYFLRIVRGIMLKGNTFIQIFPNLWPIFVFIVIALVIGVTRYRRTLD